MGVLSQAQEALARGEWTRALDLVADTGDHAGEGADEALRVRAAAAYGLGDLEGAVTAWEDLHALRLGAGDPSGAAWAACMVALHLLMDTGLMAPVRGWVARAARLVADRDDDESHAAIAMVLAYERFLSGDAIGAAGQAALAIELGERFGVTAAVMFGRTAAARLKILEGDVNEGLDMLDEVAALLMDREVDPVTAGAMYCELICAAQGLAMVDRAREWTEVMERWCHGAAVGPVNGRCRVHRAELLRLSGPGDAAEREALGACADLRPWLRREYGWPLVELGNIRLRRGDLAGAEESFLAAHRHVWSPQPGLALLRLAQGHVQVAASLIAEAIQHPVEMPSKEHPPFDDLRLAPLLSAQTEIALQAGDAEVLRQAAEALQAIADRYPSTALAADAALARGRSALLADDLETAIAASSVAVSTWADLGAPFETASARMVLADAHRAGGHVDRARLEWEAASADYRTFGAVLHEQRVNEFLQRGAPVAPPGPPTTATFLVVGEYRRIDYLDAEILVPDLKGFRYLAALLANPGREFHVLDLVALESGASGRLVEGGLPLLDDEARESYRRRLAEVEEDIDEADANDDLARLELAQRDRDYLIAELTRAAGLGGRQRETGSSVERARSSVTRSLRYALRRLGDRHRDLAQHLDRLVRTGVYCSYLPDPVAPVHWDVEMAFGPQPAAPRETSWLKKGQPYSQ